MINVQDYHFPAGWTAGVKAESRAAWYCRQLEAGEIVFFGHIPFNLPKENREFLLSQRQTNSRLHKNLSYRPKKNLLRGVSASSKKDLNRLRGIMQSYSTEVTKFLSEFLAPYAENLSLDFASFRPLEEKGRDLPLHKRNDLLHVDSFPTRPTNGARILRVFTNINPTESRIWNTTGRFETLAERFADEAGLNNFASSNFFQRLLQTANKAGLPVAAYSPYDKFMLRFHDFLKENKEFQSDCEKIRLEFPPLSTWIVFTDGVPHAALSGQFALEHTYIVPLKDLVASEESPIRLLEALCKKPLSI